MSLELPYQILNLFMVLTPGTTEGQPSTRLALQSCSCFQQALSKYECHATPRHTPGQEKTKISSHRPPQIQQDQLVWRYRNRNDSQSLLYSMGNVGYLLETTGRPLNLSGRSCGRSFSGDGSNEMIGTGLLVCWSECVTQEGQLFIPIVADYNLARGDSDRSVCCASAHPRLRRSKLIFLMWILAIRWSFIYILMRLTLHL